MAKEKENKYSLPFVLDGKPFKLSKWTYKKHKEVLKETSKWEKIEPKLSEKELDEKYRNILILKGLHEIDPNVKEENLDELHPEELLALFSAIYYSGRESIIVKEDFRKGKKSPTK